MYEQLLFIVETVIKVFQNNPLLAQQPTQVTTALPGVCTNIMQILIISREHTEDCQTVVKRVANPH